ncbi:hypothetical protein HYG77_38785 (plasmid) [Rhodococcus sp. ZPP]|uniref:hypothetical protein n=1 Tax=Rhodococcus sp. ZPP TaxID=2749906 RepID=UPI001AD85BFA|nr:hypothetical protein [Rhodococcus sp. ZPP]QTJ71383.1 hypothetical protein HYG77_38785 [Rhodococcus sp. ZPP]
MPIPSDIPRQPARPLSPTDVEIELAGIKAGLEMGGLEFTDLAEQTARSVLIGELTGEEAIARNLAELNRRLAQ